MKKVIFNFEHIHSYRDFYSELNRLLPVPEYFGNNLDALYDYIGGIVELPLEIQFVGLNAFQKRAFSRLIQLLKELDEKWDDFFFSYPEN